MEREYVNSSMLTCFGYDADNSTLEVEFKNGVVWQYSGVAENVYHDMKNSASAGKFFHANIKGQYAESQVG